MKGTQGLPGCGPFLRHGQDRECCQPLVHGIRSLGTVSVDIGGSEGTEMGGWKERELEKEREAETEKEGEADERPTDREKKRESH